MSSRCIYRHLTAIWQGFRVWWRGQQGSEYAVYLIHDLSMLRLIETFCESAPQLTLMAYIILFTNQARTIQCKQASSLRQPDRIRFNLTATDREVGEICQPFNSKSLFFSTK